jgi:hypothetical protein
MARVTNASESPAVLERMLAPDRYWSIDAVRSVLDRTLTYWTKPDLAGLPPAELRIVALLVAAGRIAESAYQDQLHHQAIGARRRLAALDRRFGSPPRTRDLLALYDASQGPIAATLENELLPFLPVDGFTPGKNVYPWAVEEAEVDRFLADRPRERDGLLHLRSAVRRSVPGIARRDLRVLRRYPDIEVLHPGLERRLTRLLEKPARAAFYAVPYSLAWAGPLRRIQRHLWSAANASQSADFAEYLRQRARDLLTDDYEAGDAAWVRGSFGQLDAVIGSHEVYDDDLFGAKSFFGLSILLRDRVEDAALRAPMAHLQAIEDQLPCDRPKAVRTDIAVGVYETIAAFGNGRAPSAQILPNESHLIRKYGRKITLRSDVTMHPRLVARQESRWRAVMVADHWPDFDRRGGMLHAFWHEIGHYLGPETDDAGRPVVERLGVDGPLIEELKAELVSQSALQVLFDRDLLSEHDHRAAIAYGLLSSFRPVRPRRSQEYETLSVMELNFFLEAGLLVYDGGRLGVRYERHTQTIRDLLTQVLAIQATGSQSVAAELIERYSTWDHRHDTIAGAITAAFPYRFLNPGYGILGDTPDDP